MYDEKTYELIDKVLSGVSTDNEQAQYDQFLKFDKNFKTEVQRIQKANESIHQLGLLQISGKLDNIHKRKTKQARVQKVGIISGVLLVAIGAFYLFNDPNQKEKLVNKEQQEVVIAKKNNTADNKAITSDNLEEYVVQYDQTIESIPNVTLENRKLEKTVELENTEEINVESNNGDPETVLLVKEDSVKTKTQNNLTQESSSRKECPVISYNKPTVTSACVNQENGKIVLDKKSISGGERPYAIKLMDKNGDVISYATANLPTGIYSLEISDKNNCTAVINDITVTEKRCIEKYELKFSPRYGENLKFPVINGVYEYDIKILNQSNDKVFQKTVMDPEQESWDGKLNNGELINSGIYLIEIQYDGEVIGLGTISVI